MAEVVAQHIITVSEPPIPAVVGDEQVLSPATRQRLAVVGNYYRNHANTLQEIGARVVIMGAAKPEADSEGFAAKQLGTMFGVPQDTIMTVNTGDNPFVGFRALVEDGFAYDSRVTPEWPLGVVASRSYAKRVLAPIARAAFGIDVDYEDGIKIMPAERALLTAQYRHRLRGMVVQEAIERASVQPYDISSLIAAGKEYESVMADMIAYIRATLGGRPRIP